MSPERNARVARVEWHDPPESALAAWRVATASAFESGNAAECPTGDGGVLRFFFARSPGRADPERGSFWIWCPVCHAYEHASASVPGWWSDVEVPAEVLTHTPEWLEDHWDDRWLVQR